MGKKQSLYELKASLSHLQWHPAKYAEVGRRNGVQFDSMPQCMSVDAFARAGDNVCVKVSWVTGKGEGVDSQLIKFYDQLNLLEDKDSEISFGEDFIGPSDELLLKASEYDPDAEEGSDDLYDIDEDDLIADKSIDDKVLEKNAESDTDEEDINEFGSDEGGELEDIPEEEKVLAEAFSDVPKNPANNTLIEDVPEETVSVSHPFFYLIYTFKKGFKLNDDSKRTGPLEYSDEEITLEAIKNSNETREISGDWIKGESAFLFTTLCKIANNNAFYFYKNLAFVGHDTTKVEKKYAPLDVDLRGHLGTNDFK